MNAPKGHRERLRQKFQQNPGSISEAEYLELLLTYAIPRRDVSMLARDLLSRFGSLLATISAPSHDLLQVDGIGESTVTFLQLHYHLLKETLNNMTTNSSRMKSSPQLDLFELEPNPSAHHTVGLRNKKKPVKKERTVRVFAEDEVANTLNLLPKVTQYHSFESFKQFLNETLPYNAADTRQRRASYILNRFFPENDLDIPLTFYLSNYSSQADLKPVIFYHILKAEPIAAMVAEELIWPALPLGMVERERIRELILQHRPNLKEASLSKILQAIYHTYDLLEIGSANDTVLQFHLHKGTLESFLYTLTSEFTKPGMYSFETLFNGLLQRWLLWDREWIRRQLYNLQDLEIISKVSEIDTVRQFTLAVDQITALHQFFENPKHTEMAIREVG